MEISNKVEAILSGRFAKSGEREYLVKWVGLPESECAWVPISNLNCSQLIKAYENSKRRRAVQNGGQAGASNTSIDDKKHNNSHESTVGFTNGHSSYTQPYFDPFAENLEAERIIGKIRDKNTGKHMFLIKWKGLEEADLIPREIANVRYPQVVISFYQERLCWRPKK